MNKEIYITINHLDNYGGSTNFRVNDTLTLKKDHNNPYDDEAIIAYNRHGAKCGYVANSTSSVARGTYSAGRLYDTIDEESKCVVHFITEENIIALMKEGE